MMNDEDSASVREGFLIVARYAQEAAENDSAAAQERNTPSCIFKPKLQRDGNQWCALYGENLVEGVAGFGDSPHLAMVAFDKAWYAAINKAEKAS